MWALLSSDRAALLGRAAGLRSSTNGSGAAVAAPGFTENYIPEDHLKLVNRIGGGNFG